MRLAPAQTPDQDAEIFAAHRIILTQNGNAEKPIKPIPKNRLGILAYPNSGNVKWRRKSRESGEKAISLPFSAQP
jgi:hypothetical protein